MQVISNAVPLVKRALSRLRTRPKTALASTESYSQCGEDRIIAFLFQELKIPNPTYLELGANDPVFINNTYLFYRFGARGVCVEADPALCANFRRVRPCDTILNVAVAPETGPPMTLHIFESSASGLNTVSSEWAEHGRHTGGHHVKDQVSVTTLGIADLLAQHFTAPPNLLSIDIEGLDLPVIRAIDLASYRPDVICAETFLPMSPQTGFKDTAIAESVVSRGYRVFADTWINTIYVREECFPRL